MVTAIFLYWINGSVDIDVDDVHTTVIAIVTQNDVERLYLYGNQIISFSYVLYDDDYTPMRYNTIYWTIRAKKANTKHPANKGRIVDSNFYFVYHSLRRRLNVHAPGYILGYVFNDQIKKKKKRIT